MSYTVDSVLLTEFQEENYDHSILTCLNRCGIILPESSVALEWIFSPIESRAYVVCLGVLFGGKWAC